MDNALDLLTSGIGLAYSLFTYLLLAVSVYVMAKKDGLDTAWLAWIPIINVFVMLQIADMDWWYILLFLVPCINLVVWIMMWWRFARRGESRASYHC